MNNVIKVSDDQWKNKSLRSPKSNRQSKDPNPKLFRETVQGFTVEVRVEVYKDAGGLKQHFFARILTDEDRLSVLQAKRLISQAIGMVQDEYL